ncbi:hypothetical protein HPB47_020851 [Ixodes persulcatus]|uniref:Uncharacterized protein n=1 Tax=Ixodes persulcatus TaxID=34615 RepID=A0AC60QF18_IXOPE|nr:hypothetical protein HPB47_020851 [Ixodes persulcatus]
MAVIWMIVVEQRYEAGSATRNTFDVSCPPGASVDSIFDAAAAIVGTAELFSVQHLGGTNFQLSVTSSSAMSRIVNAGALTIGGTSVPIVPITPTFVDCTQRRSYSAVAGCGQGDFPALTPASQTPKSQDRPPTTPLPPPAVTVATQGSGDTSAPAEPPVTTPSEITPTSQQSQLASDTDADSNASQDAAEPALSNAVESVSVHAHTPPSPGSGEVLVKEEAPPTPELRPSPLPSWSDITEDSASSSDDRLIIDEVACDKDSALPRGRDRRRGTSEELRKTCSRSRSPHGGAEDGKRVLSSSGESGSPRSTPAPAAASKRLRKDLTALSDSSCITFHGLGVGLYLLRGRCPPGVFVRLLLATAEYVLWRNRCCAVRQARRSRALWPLLWRLRRELVGHLEEQLFFLGEQEFLRRWSCRYPSVRDSRIELRFSGAVGGAGAGVRLWGDSSAA